MGLTKPRSHQLQNLDYKQAVRAVSITNVTLAGSAPTPVDGVSLALNDRILVTGQSTASQNGIYRVSVLGNGSNGTWARAIDADESGDLSAGIIVMVTEGSTYADTTWKLTTNNPITVGSTSLTFEVNTGAGSGTVTSVSFTGGLISVATANSTPALTVAGTSGGIPYFTSTSTWATSALLTASALMLGGGAGATPTTTTTGSGVVTALGVNTGSAGAVVLFDGALGTPTSGTMTNVSGTAASLTAGNATNTAITDDTSTASTMYPTWVTTTTGNLPQKISSTKLTFTPSTGTLSVTALSASGNITAGNVSATGIAGTLSTAAQTTITSVGTLGSLAVTNAVSLASITKSGTDGTGNIGQSNNAFNTIFGKSTSAQYADLAENYLADAQYAPGTVVAFGGTKEITISNRNHNTAVAGIVSTNPGYLMNAGQTGQWVLPIALTGRVPCRVQGPVKKGTVLVTSDIPGTAMAVDRSKFEPGCVVGKSLEVIDSTDVSTIEVGVGRL